MAIELLALAEEIGKATKEVLSQTCQEGLEKIKQTGDAIIKEMPGKNIGEITDKCVEDEKFTGHSVLDKLDDIKNLTPEQLYSRLESNKETESSVLEKPEEITECLTDKQKEKIKEETGWSEKTIDAIDSWQEYEIYKNADLSEADVGDKKCLVKNDIDWNQKDAMGRTNKERAEQGLSPISKDGSVIELHHIGQHSDSPLAELTQEEHRGKGNDAILHDKSKVSEIDRHAFSEERSEHWVIRAQEGDKAA